MREWRGGEWNGWKLTEVESNLQCCLEVVEAGWLVATLDSLEEIAACFVLIGRG